MAKFNITQGNLSFSINPVFAHTNTKYLAGSMYEDAADWSSRKQNINAVDLDWGLATSWDNISATKPSTISTTADIIKAIKYASTVGGSSNSGTVTSVTIQAGTNISVNNTAAITTSGTRTISHATPIGASSGKKGNNSAPLLASITTDAQGHVTGFTTITAEQLYNLIKPYLPTTINKTLSSISVTGYGLPQMPESNEIFMNFVRTYPWNKGTVYATYSDGTLETVTSSATYTLSSSDTSIIAIDNNNTIRGMGLGTATITATYTYTENGATRTVTETVSLDVVEEYVSEINWENTDHLNGSVGDNVVFPDIQVWYADGFSESVPYNTSDVKLYTNQECTIEYNNNTQYTDQPVWAKYWGVITDNCVYVTLTSTANKTLTEINVSEFGLPTGTIFKKTYIWKYGKLTATYSDGTSKPITGNGTERTLTLSSSNTDAITVDNSGAITGKKISGVALGTSLITATYTYTENGVTKTITKNKSLTVEEPYVDGVEWNDLDPVSGNVGDDIDFGFINVIYADGSEEMYPYNYLSGVKLYTDASCTNEYNKNTQYTNQPVWVSYEGFVSSSPKMVTLTPSTTYYYSAGTTEVTTSNYTTANNARSVTSISQIPSSLDISSISRKKVYIVLPEGCTPIAKTSANIAIEFTTQTVNNHVIYTSATNIGSGSTCTISK